MTDARMSHPEHAELLAAAGIGTWSWNPATGEVSWDPTTQHIYGVEEAGFDGTFESYAALIHPEDVASVSELIESLAERGGEYTTKHRIVQPSGIVRWIEGQGRIVVENGIPTAGFGVVYDVTDRTTLEDERDQLRVAERAAQAARTATEQDLAFLIQISDALSQSLNLDTVLDRLRSLLVPSIADRCLISVRSTELNGSFRTAHSDRQGMVSLVSLAGEKNQDLIAATGRIGTTHLASLRQSLGLPGTLPAQAQGLAIALWARGERIGTLLVERDDGILTARSESLLRAISRRASSAFDTAALFQEQLTVSNLLTNSVRPTQITSPSGLDVAVHYQAATELARLGGDFYDFFPLSDGKWMVIIGDITGKGMAAAARAGLVRSSIRAAASLDGDPVAVLRAINTVMRQDPDRPMLSLVAVTLERRQDTHLYVLANAGHPAPFIMTSEGTHRDIEANGVLIGFLEHPPLESVSGVLDIGDTLVLFSDGATDARLGAEEFGRDQIVTTAREVAGAGADSITKAVAASIDIWARGRPQDDITLIAATTR